MNLNDAPSGYAFEGDYVDPQSDVGVLREARGRQVAHLVSAGRSGGADRIVSVLRDRRQQRPDLPRLDALRGRGGRVALQADGQVVVASADHAAVRDRLTELGFDAHSRDRFVSLRHGGGRAEVDRAIEACRRLGVAAWPVMLMTTAAVGKGLGSPYPAEGLGSFADYAPAPTGTPARVAVIDTGIARDPRPGDGWLDGVPRDPDDGNVDPLDALPAGPDGFLDLQAGHGTFVAGVVARVAPGADIRVYRGADSDGVAPEDLVAELMIQAWRDGAQIINVSLAGRTADDEPPQSLAAAVREIDAGSGGAVVIVAAAGNDPDSRPYWPAALPGVEAVAALTAGLEPTDWSSRGDFVRFSTVGEGVRSVYVPGQESPLLESPPDTFPADAWAIWSGTSFAAPQITGAVARICQEVGVDPRRAVEILDERGQSIPDFGKAMRILPGV